MRRPSLSTKLLAAAVPLLLAIGALLFVTVRNDLDKVHDAERSAQLGAVWGPMIDALAAVGAERDIEDGTVPAPATPQELPDTTTIGAGEVSMAARSTTDQAINTVRSAIEALGENEAAVAHITSARSSLSAARRNLDMAAANMVANTEPLAAYGLASAELVAVARLLPPAAGNPELGRQLLAVEKIAESNLAAAQVIQGADQFAADPSSPNSLIAARNSLDQLESAVSEFEVIAPDEWASQFRRSGMTVGFASFRIDVDRALRATDTTVVEPIDVDAFRSLINEGNNFQREISASIVAQAQAEAESTRQATLVRIAIILGAALIAMAVTWFITRSIAKRIRQVAMAANQVATRQLPALVHAMRDPKGRALPTIDPVNAKGSDELAELAESFNTMQRTLVNVAEEQVTVLRRGVSDIFINMARRNRSLVDRQLAMLDGFEAEVHDPDVLANYYQLDHLATRMRRNAESLLVLANEEPRRRRTGPTDVDNVVRASIGEIEDYRRIEVEHLDSMKVRGNVVADIAHLFAELLDNAAAFSPPNTTVRVGGRHTEHGYTVRIQDAGMSINADRLEELNELLRNPPIVGLSVEPTLGMSVVSLLAAKHGITVTLRAGDPGLTVDVELPEALSADAPTAMEAGSGGANAAAAPASATPAFAASNGLRIDQDVVAQFAAGQGPQMTSASVNNAFVQDGTTSPMPEHIAAGVNGYSSNALLIPEEPSVGSIAEFETAIAADHAESVDAADDSTFVLPDTFGIDSYAVTIDEPSSATAEADDELIGVEPMFRSTPLVFGGSDASDASDASSDGSSNPSSHVSPLQLDRPNISTRLTDAFQRSHLSHTSSSATAANGSAAASDDPFDAVEVPVAPDTPVASAVPSSDHSGHAPSLSGRPTNSGASFPPPPSAQPAGEFRRPLAPPASASGPTSQPVTPADAHPAPRIVARPPVASSLPTRKAAEVDGGPDRMANLPGVGSGIGPSVDEEAGALAAALAAFDRRLDDHHANKANGNGNGFDHPSAPQQSEEASLPTRTRAAVTTPMSNYDDRPESTTSSKLDPEQLRARLRSFQNGVHGAVAPTQTQETPSNTARDHNFDADSAHGENR